MSKRSREEAGLDEDPLASDGSDYDSEVSDETTSDDGDVSVESEVFFEEAEQLQLRSSGYVFEKGLDPKLLPPNATITVEELRRLIEQHTRSRTLHAFLLNIDTTADACEEAFSEPQEVGAARWVICKAYCSTLHSACLDPNGPRGEEKIRLILEAAKRSRVNVSSLLVRGQMAFVREESIYGMWRENLELGATPLSCLIHNTGSTVESFRLLCEAWPQVVHLSREMLETEGEKVSISTLADLIALEIGGTDRTVELAKILLETAEKTALGAKGLISDPGTFRKEMNPYSLECRCTVLQAVTSYAKHPERFLPLFLRYCPDSLKHCTDLEEPSSSTFPLHNIARSTSYIANANTICCQRSRESVLKSIEAFLSESTLEALAVALLFTDYNGDLGFHLVKEAIELVPHKRALEWQMHMEFVIQALVHRKDRFGRTLLHYIASSDDEVNEGEFRAKENEISEEGNDFLDPSEEEWEELQQMRKELEARNRGYIVEVCQWILGIDVSAANAVDSYGMNPFHFALLKGKKWENGLKDLAKLVPEWPKSPERKTGLYPFMLAATPECIQDNSVDTIYNLLRFDSAVVKRLFRHGNRKAPCEN